MKTKLSPAPSPKPSRPRPGGIVGRPPAELRPWPGDGRAHSDWEPAYLMASIRLFGFTEPVLIDEIGTILSGRTSVQAALNLNLPSVPTRVISGLTRLDKYEYVLADYVHTWQRRWATSPLEAELTSLFNTEISAAQRLFAWLGVR